MCSLAYQNDTRLLFAIKIQIQANKSMQPEVFERGGLLDNVEARSTFLDQIKSKQFKDAKMSKICEQVLQGEVKVTIL